MERNLTARQSLIAEIAAALSRRRVVALCGLGGTGKTMLAIDYALRNANSYDVVYVIPADEPWSMNKGFASLASEMWVPDEEGAIGDEVFISSSSARTSRVVTTVKNWLGRRGRWLLIFDDVYDRKDLEAYLPSVAHGGHIIITSRNPIWHGIPTATVRGFDRAESVGYLLRRTGELDSEVADALAEEVGDLPLALAQAGAYIEETGRPLVQYLGLFRQQPAELLARSATSPVTVAMTWERSLAEVFQRQPAAELLSLLSVVPLDEVPRRLLSIFDPVALEDAISVLRLHSLIEVHPDALRMHRLVKLIVRHQLSSEDRRWWTEIARRHLQTSASSPDEGVRHLERGTEHDVP
jgi:hypothetical protein